MLTYEYECESCGVRFECQQAITEEPITECPQCGGKIHRLISSGVGFISKGPDNARTAQQHDACSLEQIGKTCCGRDDRCGSPPCGTEA